MAYIYCIKNNVNDKVYIGKTIRTVDIRFKEHIKDANNKRCNSKLHRAMNKYGIEHFYYEVLEQCLEEESSDREQYYIKKYDSVENGYNISYGGEGESQVDFSQIEELFLQGYTFKEIANITGHTEKTVSQRLRSAGYESPIGSIGKPSGYTGKGKKVIFEGKEFNSLTTLAKFLQQNVNVFKEKEINTIVKGISKNSKAGTPYCGYRFYRL